MNIGKLKKRNFISKGEGKIMEDLIAKGSEHILFVDDEVYLADIGKELLEDYGYVVESMTSSKEAFELFEKYPDQFDLVITDYTMPEMNGEQLARKIRRINPNVPIIMCAGIFLDSEITNGLEFERILVKPIDMEDILKNVREVLDNTSV